MNRADLRGLFRRRVQESVANLFSDDQANTLLRLGLQQSQMKVKTVDPEAFIYTDRADQVLNQELYEVPAGCITIHDLRALDSSTGLYTSLGAPITRAEAQARTETEAGDGLKWFRFSSRYIGLSPKPSANLTNGLEIEWEPTLTMADDTTEPLLHPMLHMLIVLYAEKFAMGDTGESGGKVDPDLAPYVNSIPQFYQPIARGGRITVGVDRRW